MSLRILSVYAAGAEFAGPPQNLKVEASRQHLARVHVQEEPAFGCFPSMPEQISLGPERQ